MAADPHHHQQLHRQNSAAKFEQNHVQQVYDEIASSVNDIQHRAWPNVKRFLKKLQKGALVADIGCGNGRYLSINSNTYKIGVDVCQPLVDSARSKGHEVTYADNLTLPLRSDMFDAVVSIGVVHHFCSPDRRVKAIQELTRIMRPGGKLMLYVWAYEQKHRKFDSQDVLVPCHESKSLTRTDSTASCQSSSGFSSTSSFSEDELPEQDHPEALSRHRWSRGRSMSSERSSSKDRSLSKDRSCSKERPSRGGERRSRKTSISLEDLTTLSNFNSNYYSLDFSPNSPRKQLLSDSRVDNQNDGNSLVKECRKIEASLRALSSGCLVKKDLQNMSLSNEEIDRINSDMKKCQHGSLENLKNSSKRAKFPGRSERLKVNSPVSSSEESLNSSPYQASSKYSDKFSPLFLSPSKDVENQRVPVSRNLSTEDILLNGSPESRSPIDIYLDDDDDVFFATNDNVASNKHKRIPAKGKFSNMVNADPVVDVFDQVDVQFKPDRPNSVFKLKTKQKESKENEKSVFGLLKSKVFQIFSRDNDDNGAKDVKPNLVNSKSMPKVNNHVKETSMTPELPNDLKNMAKELNFKVREFPLSSCLELPKDPGSPMSPRSPKFRLKFDLGGESLENSLVSPQRLKQFSFRQDSVEQYVKSPRGSRKFKRSDSFEKRIISPRSDMKLQLQRTNSGNDLRKSAILNRTKQSSPTLEQSRSNPFIVRSFSSDYVEDPSTEYPFKNMKENGSEEIHVESPTEVLSVEQTLYDCFIKIDLDKVNGNAGNRGHRGSIDSEISVDSLDFDDRLEFGETLYNDEGINMVVNDADELNRNVSRYCEKMNGRQESQGSNKRDSSGDGADCTNEHREKRMVANGDERNLSNNTELRFSDTNTVSSENEFSRKKKGSYKGVRSNAKSLNKTMLTKDVCNANTNNERTNKADQGDGNICDNETSGRNHQSEIPDVSCVGKEGKVSTKLCRYYHVFREGELEKLISSHIKDLHIVQCFYDHANWCLVAMKVDKG